VNDDDELNARQTVLRPFFYINYLLTTYTYLLTIVLFCLFGYVCCLGIHIVLVCCLEIHIVYNNALTIPIMIMDM